MFGLFEHMQKFFNICPSQIVKWIWPANPFFVDCVYELLKSREIFVIESFWESSKYSGTHDCVKIVMGEHLISGALEFFE